MADDARARALEEIARRSRVMAGDLRDDRPAPETPREEEPLRQVVATDEGDRRLTVTTNDPTVTAGS